MVTTRTQDGTLHHQALPPGVRVRRPSPKAETSEEQPLASADPAKPVAPPGAAGVDEPHHLRRAHRTPRNWGFYYLDSGADGAAPPRKAVTSARKVEGAAARSRKTPDSRAAAERVKKGAKKAPPPAARTAKGKKPPAHPTAKRGSSPSKQQTGARKAPPKQSRSK